MNKFVEHPENLYHNWFSYCLAVIKSFLRGFKRYFLNYILAFIPSYTFRNLFYRYIYKLNFTSLSSIHLGIKFFGNCSNVHIGKWTVINSGTIIDGREKCIIGNNVSISREVVLLTMSHDPNDTRFLLKGNPIVIEDDVWIGLRAMVLPGVTIGKGAVVGAGSVVTKNVAPYTVVAGNPAKEISKREVKAYSKVYYKPFLEDNLK